MELKDAGEYICEVETYSVPIRQVTGWESIFKEFGLHLILASLHSLCRFKRKRFLEKFKFLNTSTVHQNLLLYIFTRDKLGFSNASSANVRGSMSATCCVYRQLSLLHVLVPPAVAPHPEVKQQQHKQQQHNSITTRLIVLTQYIFLLTS